MSNSTKQTLQEQPKQPIADTPFGELNEADLEGVAGGLNPQPLPPIVRSKA